jgi:hypothetical protein
MSVQQLEPQTRRWLVWEWRIALITVVGGFVIALAWLGYTQWKAAHAPKPMSPEQMAKVTHQISMALCTASLVRAQAFGIIPPYGKLATPNLGMTRTKGRYVCVAATDLTKYMLIADLACRDLRDQRCVSLYSVVQENGTVLYRRQGG